MKALSLTRPWGTLAILGEKGWDTRPRVFNRNHFGITAIHASKGFPKKLKEVYPGGLEEVWSIACFQDALKAHGYESPSALPESAILGVVDILRYERTEAIRDSLSEKERAFGVYTDGRWAYELANPQRIEPIPCGGHQGLWTVPDDIERQINEQLPNTQRLWRASKVKVIEPEKGVIERSLYG
jgi:hypothetical protein